MPFDCLEASFQLITELRSPLEVLRRADGKLHGQLRTAATSIPLNLAEGSGRDGKDRQHFWRIARGSAEEVRAILRVAVALGDLDEEQTESARETLERIHQMLWRLTR